MCVCILVPVSHTQWTSRSELEPRDLGEGASERSECTRDWKASGIPRQALHSSDGLLAGRTLSPLFSHPMISSLSRYEFWKTDIPALPPYAARAASKAELLITLLFCTPISLTEKNNRTAFPDKPFLRELILGATPTQELGRGWRCVGIRRSHNSFLMVRFSHPSTSVVAVN